MPISPEHIADLELSRIYLEPALGIDVPPSPIAQELADHARLAAATLERLNPKARLHQERLFLQSAAKTVAAPRLRDWLGSTWDLSLRVDAYLMESFGIDRGALPIRALLDGLCLADTLAVQAILKDMREAFSDRCRRALARSAAPLISPLPREERASGAPRREAQDGAPLAAIERRDPR